MSKEVDRHDDVSPRGRLIIMQQDDGDIIVRVSEDIGQWSEVEFCAPGPGGGKSPKTIEALHKLMEAMEQDNKRSPRT